MCGSINFCGVAKSNSNCSCTISVLSMDTTLKSSAKEPKCFSGEGETIQVALLLSIYLRDLETYARGLIGSQVFLRGNNQLYEKEFPLLLKSREPNLRYLKAIDSDGKPVYTDAEVCKATALFDDVHAAWEDATAYATQAYRYKRKQLANLLFGVIKSTTSGLARKTVDYYEDYAEDEQCFLIVTALRVRFNIRDSSYLVTSVHVMT